MIKQFSDRMIDVVAEISRHYTRVHRVDKFDKRTLNALAARKVVYFKGSRVRLTLFGRTLARAFEYRRG